MKVAIIGAGMAGITCADRLLEAGHHPVLFEKARGVGGRMATRRIVTSQAEVSFDLGCPYFTARTASFGRQIERWRSQGLVAQWPDAGPDAWVGVPGMNAMLRHAAGRHELVLGYHARTLMRSGEKWTVLSDTATNGPFDCAILAIPPEQAAPILSLHDFAMARVAAAVRSSPCWTLMVAFEHAIASPALRGDGMIIGAATRNNAKPGRGQQECWTVHTTADWSVAHLAMEPAAVEAALRPALQALLGPLPPVLAAQAHRWRYARSAGAARAAMWNPHLQLGACGDWLAGDRVESAWMSGSALAEMIVVGNERSAATA